VLALLSASKGSLLKSSSPVTVISKEKPEVTQLLLMHTVCCLHALTSCCCLSPMWLTWLSASKGSTVTVISKEKPEVPQLLLMHTVSCLVAMALLCLPTMCAGFAICVKGKLANKQKPCENHWQGEAVVTELLLMYMGYGSSLKIVGGPPLKQYVAS